LIKNNVKLNGVKLDKRDVNYLIKQKPNRKILGIARFRLFAYNYASKKKPTKFNKWIIDVVGEPPVYLDTNLVNSTVEQLKYLLFNKGYFNGEVDKSIKYRKNKALVTYYLMGNTCYKIRNINFECSDSSIYSLCVRDSNNRIINKGDIYNSDVISEQRQHLAKMIKDNGYFNFVEDYISVIVDTNLNQHKTDITFVIAQPVNTYYNDPKKHPLYFVKNINVYYDLSTDTTYNNDTITYNNIYYISKKHLYKPKILNQFIFIKQNEIYRISEAEETYKKLSSLNNFKLINIIFSNNKNFYNGLDCNIQLIPTKKQSVSLEVEGTNTGGNLGVAGNVVYQNVNLFKGFEILKARQKLSFEMQKVFEDESKSNIKSYLPFNTFEMGTELSLYLPKFLLPVNPSVFSKYTFPKTILSSGINYQKRRDYTRYITNLSYGYEWKESIKKTHLFYPVEINSIKINLLNKSFYEKIKQLYDKQILNSYQDHLIIGAKYSYIYNEQQRNKIANFRYLRLNYEMAGNIMWLLNRSFKSVMTDNSYTLFNIHYAQYVKIELDYRYYSYFNKDNIFVYRFLTGVGVPYGNMNVLPFEKSFFAGGANSMRGWLIRSLGPGSFKDTMNYKYDKIGDVLIENNLEIRFPIYRYLKGAIFSDIGNIWLRQKDSNRPGANFMFNKFLHDMAVDVGIAFRFDFSYFVIRMDCAVPFKDPSKNVNDRWVFRYTKFKDINFNFGIGYPF